MSAKKQWTGQEKLSIVLQGLKGTCSVSELCNEHGITQGMYYKWRDQLLTDGAKLFERGYNRFIFKSRDFMRRHAVIGG